MSKLSYRTIADERPQGKPKVYFSCHPDDFSEYFEELFREPEEAFENRVFDKKDLDYGSTADYQLTFEIQHTEYPESEETSHG